MATDVMTQTRQKDSVRVWRLHNEMPGEVRLCVPSEARERTQRSMLTGTSAARTVQARQQPL